jgi:nicotinamide-nucleotide amidase
MWVDYCGTVSTMCSRSSSRTLSRICAGGFQAGEKQADIVEIGGDLGVLHGLVPLPRGTEEKPVGLVFIGAKAKGKMSKFERHVFPGNRAEIREAAAARAMQIAIDIAISLKK